MFYKLLAVFIGGGGGALLRYGAALLAGRCWGSGLPGTFAVNMIGCLAIGALYGAAEGRWALSDELRLFIAVGMLGALTTFSTLNWEIFALLRSGRIGCAALYFLLSATLGLLCTGAGYFLTHPRGDAFESTNAPAESTNDE